MERACVEERVDALAHPELAGVFLADVAWVGSWGRAGYGLESADLGEDVGPVCWEGGFFWLTLAFTIGAGGF